MSGYPTVPGATESGVGAGGSTTIVGLNDVDIDLGTSQDFVLKVNSAGDGVIAEAGGGGGVTTFEALTDVNVDLSASPGYALISDGANVIAADLSQVLADLEQVHNPFALDFSTQTSGSPGSSFYFNTATLASVSSIIFPKTADAGDSIFESLLTQLVVGTTLFLTSIQPSDTGTITCVISSITPDTPTSGSTTIGIEAGHNISDNASRLTAGEEFSLRWVAPDITPLIIAGFEALPIGHSPFTWNFSTATAGSPGFANFRGNNAAASLWTEIVFDEDAASGNATVNALMPELVGKTLFLSHQGASTAGTRAYSVSAVSAGPEYTLTVSEVESNDGGILASGNQITFSWI